MNNRPEVPNISCPVPPVYNPGYYTDEQSYLNTALPDKFKLVIDIPDRLKTIIKKAGRKCRYADLDKLQLNIWGVIIPDLDIEEMPIRFSGQTLKYSSLSRPEFPNLNINYQVDNKYENYYLLYKWADLQNDDLYGRFNNKNIGGDRGSGHICEYSAPMTIYALDEYKKEVAKWDFDDCFVSSVGGIEYDFQSNANIITSTFQISYSNIRMDLV